jgi:hypothetical protein
VCAQQPNACLPAQTIAMAQPLRAEMEQLQNYLVGPHDPHTIDYGYIDFYTLAFWFDNQYHLTSVNAILTWVKLFKFLDHRPDMSILQRTLHKAATPLAWFCGSFVIVLAGSGQGFFMAFGMDMYDYRSFSASVISLLRMAVGDFDYDELSASQQMLGPVMFWLYIILVFFVLMSMFIALISEAYEDAKEERELHVVTPRLPTRGFGSLQNVVRGSSSRPPRSHPELVVRAAD